MIGTGNDQRVVPRFAPGARWRRREWPRSGGHPGPEWRRRARGPPLPAPVSPSGAARTGAGPWPERGIPGARGAPDIKLARRSDPAKPSTSAKLRCRHPHD